MDELLKIYVQAGLSYNETEKWLSEIFEGDILLSDSEDNSMNNLIETNLLTVISLKDNPTINLSIAQPSQYKIQDKLFGTGIYAYKQNALNILKKELKPDEIIIKIHIKVSKNEIFDLCSYNQKEYLRNVYKTTNKQFKTDNEFMDYVYKKGNKKISLVRGFMPLGEPLFKGSSIPDYIDTAYLILDDSIITLALDL